MQNMYKLVKTHNQGLIWTLPDNLVKAFSLIPGQTVSLRVGSARADVTVESMPKGADNKIALSNEALEALKIPPDMPYAIKTLDKKSFQLGPVVGILTFAATVPNKLHYYTNWVNLNKHGGFIYVFRGRGINVKDKTITGYYYDPSVRRWTKGTFPFPDAVMDRCYPNHYHHHRLLEKELGPGKIFNKKSMITKLDFYKALSQDNYLKNFIPDTKPFQGAADLDSFLKKYKQVFLKPVRGMKGHGITSARLSGNKIECTYPVNGRETSRLLDSVDEISNIIQESTGRKTKYVIQQAINCMQCGKGPFSLRVNPMKNGEGRWVIAGMLVLGSSGITTNYSSGGKPVPLSKLLNNIMPKLPYDSTELFQKINDLALRTAAQLDKKYGPLADLGVDIIIDTTGKPWLLEANGNPGKIAAFLQKEFPTWRITSYKYPLDYAFYLAGFPIK